MKGFDSYKKNIECMSRLIEWSRKKSITQLNTNQLQLAA